MKIDFSSKFFFKRKILVQPIIPGTFFTIFATCCPVWSRVMTSQIVTMTKSVSDYGNVWKLGRRYLSTFETIHPLGNIRWTFRSTLVRIAGRCLFWDLANMSVFFFRFCILGRSLGGLSRKSPKLGRRPSSDFLTWAANFFVVFWDMMCFCWKVAVNSSVCPSVMFDYIQKHK